MIGAHKFMDLNLKVVSGPRGKAYHMDELSELLDEGFVNSMFTFALSMQEINLTNEETALLKCVALMFSGMKLVNSSLQFKFNFWFL